MCLWMWHWHRLQGHAGGSLLGLPSCRQSGLGPHGAVERAGSMGGRPMGMERPASSGAMPASFEGLPTRFTVTTGETFVLPPPPGPGLPRAADFQPPVGTVGPVGASHVELLCFRVWSRAL